MYLSNIFYLIGASGVSTSAAIAIGILSPILSAAAIVVVVVVVTCLMIRHKRIGKL